MSTISPEKPAQATVEKPATIIAIVEHKLNSEVQKGLIFPADYNVANALASARLHLQTVQNKDKKNIVDQNGRPTGVCTEASIVKAVLQMCVEGMNVAKQQGYFIVYGDELTWQRSYHGDIAIAQRIKPTIEPYADVIRDGDTLETSKVWSRALGWIEVVTKHVKPFRKPGEAAELLGAYMGYVDTDTGEDLGAVIMDIDRIKQSWSMSKTANFDNSTHKKFPAEMAIRTVSRKRSIAIYRLSKDAYLKQSLIEGNLDSVDAEFNEVHDELANSQRLAIEATNSEPIDIPVTKGQPVQEPVPVQTSLPTEEDPY